MRKAPAERGHGGGRQVAVLQGALVRPRAGRCVWLRLELGFQLPGFAHTVVNDSAENLTSQFSQRDASPRLYLVFPTKASSQIKTTDPE